MKQPYNTVEYLGTLYNGGTGNQTGIATYTPLYRSGSMPISFRNRKIRGAYRSGLNWLMIKGETRQTPSDSVVTRTAAGNAYRTYSGRFLASQQSTGAPVGFGTIAYANQQVAALSARGAEAWNRLRPDKPDFSLAEQLLELKDVPGMLKGAVRSVRNAVRNKRRDAAKRAKGRFPSRDSLYTHRLPKVTPKKAGDFFLAVHFGWIPLLKGVQDFIKAQRKGQASLDRLIKHEGRVIRRRVELKDSLAETSETTFIQHANPWGGMTPGLDTYSYSGPRAFSTVRKRREGKTWAVGAFVYLLPPGPRTVAWKNKMLRRLMGSKVTPATVYNLMPWSWLADYFTTLGETVQALSKAVVDNLVALYSYVMRTATYESMHEATQSVLSVQGERKKDVHIPVQVSAVTTITQTMKMRVFGTPFGFGVRQTDLSNHQLSILGALGLSRLP